MRRWGMFLLFTVFLAACGDSDNPVAPDADLVGTWDFDSSDVIDILASVSAGFLSATGADQDEIDAFIDEFRADFGDGSDFSPILTIRFRANGSFENDQGDRGTWRVEGDISILVVDGDESRSKYSVDGDDLTLVFTDELWLASLRENDAFTEQNEALFSEMFDEDTNISFFFKRR